MSLCDDRGLFATDKKMALNAAVAALRAIDAVSQSQKALGQHADELISVSLIILHICRPIP